MDVVCEPVFTWMSVSLYLHGCRHVTNMDVVCESILTWMSSVNLYLCGCCLWACIWVDAVCEFILTWMSYVSLLTWMLFVSLYLHGCCLWGRALRGGCQGRQFAEAVSRPHSTSDPLKQSESLHVTQHNFIESHSFQVAHSGGMPPELYKKLALKWYVMKCVLAYLQTVGIEMTTQHGNVHYS